MCGCRIRHSNPHSHDPYYMKKQIKSVLQKVSPDLFHAISSYRFFRYCQGRFEEFQKSFRTNVYGQGEIQILSGPFHGMQYYERVVWGPITPKWLGSYENELHAPVSEALSGDYKTIIDVGAAEGYYAVGLAFKLPKCQVISYDVDPIARRRQRQLMELNRVTNLDIRKYCAHTDLENSIKGRTLVIMDIEGFEYHLLDPNKAPRLRQADILVEIHEFEQLDLAAVQSTLTDRFQDSHHIEVISQSPASPQELKDSVSELADVDLDTLSQAMDEHRGFAQSWLWMKANSQVS